MTLLDDRTITRSFGSPRPEGCGSADRDFLDRVDDRIVEVDGSVRATDSGYSARLERTTVTRR